MRFVTFDPVFGAAGDMICGALLAAGADADAMIRAMRSVSADPEVLQVVRCGVPAVQVRMHAGPAHRTLEEVLEIVRQADAPNVAKDLAGRVFSRIHAAESRVHGTHHVHFHEVGADDAVADVLGACTGLLSLGADGVRVLPVSTGSGTLTCAHGVMPVPAPATAEILAASDLTVRTGTGSGELCTPTGAALLAEFLATFGTQETCGKLCRIGCGAGNRDPADHPNVLRVMIQESETQSAETVVEVLETNLDDLSGEILTAVVVRIMEEGGRDACLIPVIMKKGRPGYILRVVCMPDDAERLAKVIARETGSLGVRCTPMVHRFVADREVSPQPVVVNGHVYSVDVKTGFLNGRPYTRKAEFDQVQAAAKEAGVPVKELKRAVEEEAWKRELE